VTIKASGSLSHTEIQTEFGGAHPICMSEYYGLGQTLPASGVIKMSDFYSQTATERINVTQGFYNDTFFQTRGFSLSGDSIGGSGFGSRSPTTLGGFTIEGLAIRVHPLDGATIAIVQLMPTGLTTTQVFSKVQFQNDSLRLATSAYYVGDSGNHTATQWLFDLGTSGFPAGWDGSSAVTVDFTP